MAFREDSIHQRKATDAENEETAQRAGASEAAGLLIQTGLMFLAFGLLLALDGLGRALLLLDRARRKRSGDEH